MEREPFQRLLLETAICTMSCDGEIHNNEIAEVNQIIEYAPYFTGADFKQAATDYIQSIQNDGSKIISDYLVKLGETELDFTQELLLLEIVIRIINADQRVDENEITFVKIVRSKLKVYDQIIRERFGDVPYLELATSISAHDKSVVDFLSGIKPVSFSDDNTFSLLDAAKREIIQAVGDDEGKS